MPDDATEHRSTKMIWLSEILQYWVQPVSRMKTTFNTQVHWLILQKRYSAPTIPSEINLKPDNPHYFYGPRDIILQLYTGVVPTAYNFYVFDPLYNTILL